MMIHKSGQAMVEYLMMIGVALLILIPTIVFFSSQTNDLTTSATFTKLDSIGSSLVESIDSIYILGEDSKTSLSVNVPAGLQNITFLNYTSGSQLLSNDLIFHARSGTVNSQLLFVTTYPFFIGNCTGNSIPFPDSFVQNPGRKDFTITSCGDSVAIWYK